MKIEVTECHDGLTPLYYYEVYQFFRHHHISLDIYLFFLLKSIVKNDLRL